MESHFGEEPLLGIHALRALAPEEDRCRVYPKVFQRDIQKDKNFGVLSVKACIALYRKLPVNWAIFAVGTNAKTPAFKPHPRWCTLHVEDDVENGFKVDGLYDNMLVLDGR